MLDNVTRINRAIARNSRPHWESHAGSLHYIVIASNRE